MKKENIKYIIIHTDSYGTMYLGYLHPHWEEAGYFWMRKSTFKLCLEDSTFIHPFLFNSRKDAIKMLYNLGITNKCKIVKFKTPISTVQG